VASSFCSSMADSVLRFIVIKFSLGTHGLSRWLAASSPQNFTLLNSVRNITPLDVEIASTGRQ